MFKDGFKKFEISKETLEKEFYNAILNEIKKIRENSIIVGEGKAAQVYSYKDKKFCLKEIINNDPKLSFNDIHTERKYQERARELGVRTPKVYFSLETDNNRKFIGMELIIGSTLEEIKKNVLRLPKEFNLEIFFSKLKKSIEILHQDRIHHRDLHGGNIMLENETSLPVIIDFGHATYEYGDQDPYIEKDFPRIGQVERFKKDHDYFREHKVSMTKLLT